MDERTEGLDLVSPIYGRRSPKQSQASKKKETESGVYERGEGKMGNEWRERKSEKTDDEGKKDECRSPKGPRGRKGLSMGCVIAA